jgi:phage shock protein PspC (stress-responsive transcriptional regulator)
MKKIININLSGRVVPIEDSAYEQLQAYIESLRRYFANEEGRDEIINDIESRIAELMSEKVRKGAACIMDSDVNEIANSMGRPEDFEGEEVKEKTYSNTSNNGGAANTASGTGQQQQFTQAQPKQNRGRFYRDSNDKFIGGVCSGLASYLNVDPAVVRLLFAIFLFLGWGFLIYIVLWIVVPAREQEGYSGKRFYRNPDNRILGGVAGGLAAYFNKDAKIIRLVFLAPFLLNMLFGIIKWSFIQDGIFFPNIVFGSLTGTSIIVYIILWIVLPEARSEYEKMEMRGEKVDVNTIKQNVQERAKEMGEELKSAAQNISNKAKEFSQTTMHTYTTEVKRAAKPAAHGVGHAIGVLFKVFFLFITGIIAFILFVVLIALITSGVAWWPVNNFLWTSSWQPVYAWGTVILFLAVPLIGLLVWLIRRIIGVKSKSSYLGWIFGSLWALGWVSLILLISSLVRDTRYYESAEPIPVEITQPVNKLTLLVSQPQLEFTDKFWWIDSDSEGWNLTEDTVKLSYIDLTVEKSPDASYHVSIIKKSAGRTARDAEERAEKIQYSVTSRDSVLDLANGFAIDKDSKYRGQIVELKIQVPVGKKIRFDESVIHTLHPVEVRSNDRRGRLRRNNRGIEWNDWFAYKVGIDYVMGENGSLIDPNKPAVKAESSSSAQPGDYRYEDSKPATTNSLEEQRRKVEEEQKKLKDLEEKAKKDSISGSSKNKKETMDDKEDTGGVPGSPIFSLIQVFN